MVDTMTRLAAAPADLLRRGLAARSAVGDRLPLAARVALLAGAPLLIGVGVVAMLHAGLGVGPADVLIGAIAPRLGLAHGTTGILLALLLAVAAIGMGRRPGPGTLLIAFGIGPVVNLVWDLLPHPSQPAVQALQLGIGLGLIAVGIAALIHADLGTGVLEMLTEALSARTGHGFARMRFSIEASLLLAGVLAGGPVGAGTVVVMAGIGPLAALAVAAGGRVLAPFTDDGHRSLARARLPRWSRL